jgi:hypothetical protein
MTNRLTYGQLFAKLTALGFVERTIELNGRSRRLFKHKDFDTATIFLPDTPLQQPVEPMHLAAVKAVLKVHGLIPGDAEEVLF